MNELYLFCGGCKDGISAGYRHALSALRECGLVRVEFPVSPFVVPIDAHRVEACSPYWRVSEGDGVLYGQIQLVKGFLRKHSTHSLTVGDINYLTSTDEWLDWLIEDDGANTLPRYLVERVGLESWDQVERYVTGMRFKPWWWRDDSPGGNRARGRARFEDEVRSR